MKETMKKTTSRKISNKKSPAIKGPERVKVANNLTDFVMGFNPGSIGTQLNQTDTIFINNRWYLISNMRQVLSQSYVEHGLIQTVVDVPVDDGMRGGVDIKTQQLDEDQIGELKVYMERENILSSIVGRALKWNRLFGGSGIIILTDQDPEQPFDLEAIGPDTPLEFRAVDMWELFWDKQSVEGYDAALQEQKFEHYSYYGTKIHKTRVMKMQGIEAPSFIRPRLRGWGISVIEPIIASINQFMKANNLTFEVLDEFKVDIFKIKNFTETLLSPQGTQAVQQRVQLANQQKNYQNAITMDMEDDWDHKQLSFSGIAEMMKEFRMQIACDLRMPISKIFGIASSGFSSGEDDIENYNSMVESQIRDKSKFDILRIIEIICQHKFGFVPDDLEIAFKPLRVLSAEQEENVKTQKFARLLQAYTAGLLQPEEFKDSCNKDNLLGVQIDATAEVLQGPSVEEGDEDPEGTPGANREPSANLAPKSSIQAPEAIQPKNAMATIQNPGDVDEALWEKAKKAVMKQYGKIKWAVVTSVYKKMGGTFKKKSNSVAWEESKHPRDEKGRFGEGGGTPADGGKSEAGVKEATEEAKKEKRDAEVKDMRSQQPKFKMSEFKGHDYGAGTVRPFDSERIMKVMPKHIKERYDFAKEQVSLNQGRDTKKEFSDGKFNYTPERMKAHEKIMTHFLNKDSIAKATPAKGEKPEITILGGRGGSGKSKLAHVAYNPDKAIVLDSDVIKKMLPGYKGWNAFEVHEESSDLLEAAVSIAREMGLNIVIDETLKTQSKALKRMETFKTAGYKTKVDYMFCPPEMAATRSMYRFGSEEAGRYVPLEVINQNQSNEETFDKLIEQADAGSFWDNSGKSPQLISKK